MKKFFDNIKVMAFISYAFLFLSNAEGMESYENLNDFNKAEINHKTVKLFLEKVDTYNKLIDSSKDKDIVVVLGNTGAGKSTLINYLNGKQLKCTAYQKIELMNPHDQDAMAIGNNDQSHTLLPKSTFIAGSNLLFYDLPGFHDNRGALINLLNASFIKNIIENARTARCVFVSGIDETTAERGSSIKQLFEISKELMPGQSIEDISSLIITKSQAGDIDELLEILEMKCPEATAIWRNNRKISHLYMPRKGEVMNDNDRDHITNVIRNTRATKINNVNIGVVYSDQDQRKLLGVFNQEIIETSKRIVEGRSGVSQQPTHNAHTTSSYSSPQPVPAYGHNCSNSTSSPAYGTSLPYTGSSADGASSPELGILQAEKSFYENDFSNEVLKEFEASKLTCLLRPIAERQYQESKFDLQETIHTIQKEQVHNIAEKISKIKEQEGQTKIEGLEKAKEEAKRNHAEEIKRLEREAQEREKAAKKKAKKAARKKAEKAARKAENSEPKQPTNVNEVSETTSISSDEYTAGDLILDVATLGTHSQVKKLQKLEKRGREQRK